jgi:hypothetical protein
MGNIIQQSSVSPEAIKADLDAFIKSKPPELRWLDFFESGPGTIVEELIAGLGSFKSYQDLADRIESTLDFARLLSSVYELAFNRGYLVPPAEAAQITLYIIPNVTISVTEAELVGTIGNYNLYSLESKTMPVGVPVSLQTVVGYIDAPEDWIVSVTSTQPFSTIVVDLTAKNVARQLERLMSGSSVITLVDDIISPGGSQRVIPLDTIIGLTDPQILTMIHSLIAAGSPNPDIYVLRRARPNQVRIYLGNGTLGFYDPSVTELEYRRLTFDDNVNNILGDTPALSIDANIASVNVDNSAAPLPTTESVRGTSRYFPVDGRVVQDGDYGRVIMKYYSAFLYDAFAKYLDWDIDMPDLKALFSDINTSTNIVTIVAHGLVENQPVRYQATANPVGGLTVNTIYYVVNVTTDTFQVSSTPAGSAIHFTSQGTGYAVFANPEVEIVKLLVNPSFTPSILSQIQSLINSRMAQGIRVEYDQIPTTVGKTLSATFVTLPGQLTDPLRSQAEIFLSSLTNKFAINYTIVSTGIQAVPTPPPVYTLVSLCVELSAQLGIAVLPGDSNFVTLAPGEFIQDPIIVTWTVQS